VKKLIPLLSLTFLSACSSAPKENIPLSRAPSSASSIEAKQLAAQIDADEVAEIEFAEESSELSRVSALQLKKGLERALSHGPIERIAVVSWGDEEYPSVHAPELSKEQRILADARNSVIKNFLQEYDEKPLIRVYSMAERPGTIDEFIGNRESKIKKSLEQSGVPNTDTSVKEPSKKSKAIVLFKNRKTKETQR
jgi:hypothetical protein